MPDLANFAGKAFDAPELRFIVSDERAARREGVSGNQEVIRSDRLSGLFRPSTDGAVDRIGRRLKWQYVQSLQHCVQLSREALRSHLHSTVS